LAFVSPVFLFPNDAGGKIRTTNVLRGLKGGAFDITLLSPSRPDLRGAWSTQLDAVCDSFESWSPSAALPRWRRAGDLLDRLPVNVVADRTRAALEAVQRVLGARRHDVVVFDFVHSAVLMPPSIDAATVCFTHNVEAEIFARHASQAASWPMRWMWRSQARKMERHERESLRRFDAVVAVSERDASHFRTHHGLASVGTIPTGVDLDFFSWSRPADPSPPGAPTVVFTGSMDWAANVDGIQHFLRDIWPLVRARVPTARFVVVGRNPPAGLVEQARTHGGVEFTGFVDDVRPYCRAAQAFVIPLRVGGGTRIKAFEAMAMGCPVVSTSIGIEGLDVQTEEHFLCRDSAAQQADAVIALLTNAELRCSLSERARRCMEERFGHRVAAAAFERICLDALQRRRSAA
jgi:glycosyltransferase involved in cell wall biosynthesis